MRYFILILVIFAGLLAGCLSPAERERRSDVERQRDETDRRKEEMDRREEDRRIDAERERDRQREAAERAEDQRREHVDRMRDGEEAARRYREFLEGYARGLGKRVDQLTSGERARAERDFYGH